MKKRLLFVTILLSSVTTQAQESFTSSTLLHRQHYKQEFITEKNSPLKAEDTGYLRFYKPDAKYKIAATFTPNSDTTSFTIPTSSGKLKRFRKYGSAAFTFNGKKQKLQLYQNLQLLQDTAHANHLFLPFKDLTNYETTYGGGRYIDLEIKNIQNGRVTIDFNKCYNPYCAYSDGYNCPIPPDANKMKIRIEAGEQKFAKDREH